MSFSTDLKEMLLDALFPVNLTCAACNEEALTSEAGVCAHCHKKLNPCPALPKLKHLDGLNAGLLYTDETKQAMHRFKYGDAAYIASFFAGFMRLDASWEVDAVVPVPLHKRRQRTRGYNQSALLAELIASREGLPVNEALLKRVKNTQTQTAFNVSARRKNVKNSFAAPPCKGMRILLIDDVKTTGSTLIECAKTLKNAGAQRVYALAACADELYS